MLPVGQSLHTIYWPFPQGASASVVGAYLSLGYPQTAYRLDFRERSVITLYDPLLQDQRFEYFRYYWGNMSQIDLCRFRWVFLWRRNHVNFVVFQRAGSVDGLLLGNYWRSLYVAVLWYSRSLIQEGMPSSPWLNSAQSNFCILYWDRNFAGKGSSRWKIGWDCNKRDNSLVTDNRASLMTLVGDSMSRSVFSSTIICNSPFHSLQMNTPLLSSYSSTSLWRRLLLAMKNLWLTEVS